MAKLESFAYAREVSDDSVGIEAAIQHGNDTFYFVCGAGEIIWYTVGDEAVSW